MLEKEAKEAGGYKISGADIDLFVKNLFRPNNFLSGEDDGKLKNLLGYIKKEEKGEDFDGFVRIVIAKANANIVCHKFSWCPPVTAPDPDCDKHRFIDRLRVHLDHNANALSKLVVAMSKMEDERATKFEEASNIRCFADGSRLLIPNEDLKGDLSINSIRFMLQHAGSNYFLIGYLSMETLAQLGMTWAQMISFNLHEFIKKGVEEKRIEFEQIGNFKDDIYKFYYGKRLSTYYEDELNVHGEVCKLRKAETLKIIINFWQKAPVEICEEATGFLMPENSNPKVASPCTP